jgi:hypothetical protein
VGAMPPVSALASGTVKTAFFTVYRFERTFGSADDFYEAYFELAMNNEKTQFLSYESMDNDSGRFTEIEPKPLLDLNLEYFDNIITICPINMGTVALGYKKVRTFLYVHVCMCICTYVNV